MTKQTEPTREKHIHGYNRMLEHIKEFIDEAEDEFTPKIHYAIESAKDKMHALGDMTREETETIASYVKRDIHDAAEFLSKEGSEFTDWLRFDTKQLESRLLDVLSAVTDTTKIELQALAERAQQENIWLAGEIAGPGTLTCLSCDHEQQRHETGEIKPCPNCGYEQFHRHAGQ